MSDFYKTVKGISQGIYREKMSRFLAFAEPVSSAEEARAVIKRYANEYHDARHCCWAYMIGTERNEYLSSDNGEPSGTAGKPILGQINSFELTNIVIVVIRYFGGIKLGTSGLIVAYREAAKLAIEANEILECHEQARLSFTFPYLSMNDVMKVVKKSDLKVIEQAFDNVCTMTIEADADKVPALREQFAGIDAAFQPKGTQSTGINTSASTAVSSASYQGGTSVTINIYQEAPVVGNGGMREFAKMIWAEYEALDYYGVSI
jgi:uncharacterized YigZ family protein